jgi:hypothetical protein
MNPSHNICQTSSQANQPPQLGATCHVNTEGAEREWNSPTITVAQIRALAGWDVSQLVVKVDLDTNTETTLDTAKLVTLSPDIGFARKIRFTSGIR